ncbi:MAG: metal ABC transporter permease [Myxococcota bacterium]|nr:metal ABC transporter permease [Myxococcota bacterium]
MGFFDTAFLWFEAVVASVAVAAALSIVGVYTIMRRVVFLPAALSQISGLGAVVAFSLFAWLPGMGSGQWIGPDLMAGTFGLSAALFLGWMPEPRHLSREAIIGAAYILASALVIAIGDQIPQDSHDIQDVLFGNAVVVESAQMTTALWVTCAVIAVHMAMLRPFLLVSSDPHAAKAHGVPVRTVDAVLFLTMGLAISTGTRTIGALPVFGFSVLPAAAALKVFRDIRLILLSASLMGAGSAFLGYFVSFKASIPTGACMVSVAGLFFVLATALARYVRNPTTRTHPSLSNH